MSDYDSDNVSIDSDDDDIVEFVPTKKRFAYTTFDNDEQNDRAYGGGKDAATYGVFMDSDNDEDDRYTSRRRHHHTKGEKAPMFVKSNVPKEEGSSVVVENEKKEEAAHPQPEEPDEAAIQEEKRLQEEQKAANDRFIELLGRGRGKKRSRTQRDEEKPPPSVPVPTDQEADAFMPGAGLGFSASQMDEAVGDQQVHQEQDSSQMGMGMGLGMGMSPAMAASFGLGAEKPRPARVDPNLGKWEKHTKGIGMKLLTKMGYKGSGGLGSKRLRKKTSGEVEETKKGISRPVEVVVRPSNLGLGFGNFKEATKLKVNRQIEAEVRGVELPSAKKKQNDSVEASSSSALPSTKELLQQQSWRRGAKQAASRKRPRRTIVSATELLENQQKKPVVIDMRGPTAAVETASTKEQEVPLGEELLHNVTLILNTYENKLHSTSHFVQSTERKIQSLQSDIDDMDRRKREGQERIEKLQTVLQIMDQIDVLLKDATTNGDETTTKVQSLLQELSENFTAEEKATLNFYRVLAPSLLTPLVQSRLKEWDPLNDDPATSERLLASVLKLCNAGNTDQNGMDQQSSNGSMAMTQSLFENQVLPKVKLALQSSKWDPMTHVDTSLALYETIVRTAEEVSPPRKEMEQDESHVLMTTGSPYDEESTNLVHVVQQELIHDTIYPKLSRSISQWKPSLDETGQHLVNRLDLWILPWLQHLDRRSIIPTLLSDVKRKLRSAQSFLQQKISNDETFFHASIETLKPWKDVLKMETLQDLTSSSVTPRLGRYLAKLPLSCNVSKENWAAINIPSHLCGLGLISSREFLSLMEGELLPNWAETLHEWLSSRKEIDLASVAEYYLEWKSRLFHSQNGDSNDRKSAQVPWMLLRNDTMICRFFYGGLAMMQAASQSDADTLDNLYPKTSNYKVVLARRAKEDRIKAQEELKILERDAKQDDSGFASTVSQKKGESSTFRDVVEEFARERDVSFYPRLDERTVDGKQVFLFGKVPIYLDSNVVFALQESQWRPLSLEQLGSISMNAVST